MEEVLGFLEADGTLVECSYGEHMEYAFKLAKRIRKAKKKSDCADDEELLRLNMIVRVHRGWFAFPLKDGKEVLTRAQYNFINKKYKGLESYENAFYILELQIESKDLTIVELDEKPYDLTPPKKYPLGTMIVVKDDFDDRGLVSPLLNHFLAGNVFSLQMYGCMKDYALLTNPSEVYEITHDDVDHEMTALLKEYIENELDENDGRYFINIKNALEDLQMDRDEEDLDE